MASMFRFLVRRPLRTISFVRRAVRFLYSIGLVTAVARLLMRRSTTTLPTRKAK